MIGRVCSIAISLILLAPAFVARAQVRNPDSKALFEEDTKERKREIEKQQSKIMTTDKGGSKFLNFSAPNVEFLKEGNMVKGSGGVLISGDGISAQAESAQVNQESKDATLEGGVMFSGMSGEIASDKAAINFDNETGTFTVAQFSMSDGDYFISA